MLLRQSSIKHGLNAKVPNARKPSNHPLSTAETEGLFTELLNYKRLTVAVSGGADSLALLHLINEWRHQQAAAPDICVVTVDHGLRPESAAEANFVGRECARLQLGHTILCWCGEKPSSNLQAAARKARYELIAAHCRAQDIDALVVAHHLNDQAETFLDRLTRGSGIYGLAAMRTEEPDGPAGLHILRPLLSTPKQRLIATLSARGIAWCEDPSNKNEDYKRVRLRDALPLLEAEGLGPDRLAETARHMARAADAIDHWVSQILKHHAEQHPTGAIRLPLKAVIDLPEETQLRLLARLIGHITGDCYPPRLSKLETLLAGLTELGKKSGPVSMSATALKRVLGGAVFQVRGTVLFVSREAGRLMPADQLLRPGETVDWDGRFKIRLNKNAPGPMVVSSGLSARLDNVLYNADEWPKAVLARAPVGMSEGQIAAFPGAEGQSDLALQHHAEFFLRQSCQI